MHHGNWKDINSHVAQNLIPSNLCSTRAASSPINSQLLGRCSQMEAAETLALALEVRPVSRSLQDVTCIGTLSNDDRKVNHGTGPTSPPSGAALGAKADDEVPSIIAPQPPPSLIGVLQFGHSLRFLHPNTKYLQIGHFQSPGFLVLPSLIVTPPSSSSSMAGTRFGGYRMCSGMCNFFGANTLSGVPVIRKNARATSNTPRIWSACV